MIKEIKNFKKYKKEYKIQFIKRLVKNLFLHILVLMSSYFILSVIGVLIVSFISFEMHSFNLANWTDFARTIYLINCFTISPLIITITNKFLED